MEKVVSFLERNVQWIALGIGALFLAYMAYSNIVETPEHLTVEVSGSKVPPGELADAIGKSDAFLRLQEGMKREQRIQYPAVDPVRELLAIVNGPVDPPPAQQASVTNTQIASTNNPGAGQFPVKDLPKPPPPQVKGVSMGRSVVLPPPPEIGPDGAPLGAPLGGVPGAAPIAAVPEAAAAPANFGQPGQPGMPAAPVGEDKDWVTVAFNIDMKALDKEFERCGIPKAPAAGPGGYVAQPNVRDEYVTQFLRVWLIREEQNNAGQWDSQTAKVIPLPPRLEVPLPGNGPENLRQALEYIRWVAPNLGHMFQPAFPEVTAGDPWYYPGQPKPQPVPGVRPPGFVPPMPPGIPPGAAPNPFGAPRTGYGGGGPPPEGGGAYPPSPFPQPSYPQPSYPAPFPQPGYGPEYYDPGAGVPGIVGGTGVPGAGSPEGKFNVAQAATAMPVFEFWAHDLTAEPGKVYHYRARYAILSPVFQRWALAPSDLASQFSLVSEPGPWSDAVEVLPRVEFYVRGQVANSAGVRALLDLFTWKQGGWGLQQVEVVPGDVIGDSKYVVVDVRQEGGRNDNQFYMLVADAQGQLNRRSAREDGRDPRYEQLKLEAQGGLAPGADQPYGDVPVPGFPPPRPGGPRTGYGP